MRPDEIRRRRLDHQALSSGRFGSPEQVMAWMLAVQSQERAVAPWSLGQRASGIREADVHVALERGTILRTHVLRPTWHYVPAADARWLLALTAARVHVRNRPLYGQLELDPPTLVRGADLTAKALEGSRHRTREELATILADGGIEATGLRLAYVLMYAELERVVISGAPRGHHHTYALLDDRAPGGAHLEGDEALAELTLRFLRSRGPATAKDIATWSGLTLGQVRRGLHAVGGEVTEVRVEERTYFVAERPAAVPSTSPSSRTGARRSIHLVQGYDEYVSSHSDSRAVYDPHGHGGVPEGVTKAFVHALILDGTVVGRWRRKPRAGSVTIELQLAVRLTAAERRELDRAAERYAAFLGVPVVLESSTDSDPTVR